MFFLEHPAIIGGFIVLIGLAVGLADLSRFRLRRVRAIAGVCFAESIRRRVLWITPLAILGVVAVAQLQKATDEQDAIRQTTKYCLFASGLIVTIAAVILACTSLPKDIDSRVIYTIVTKPTTRLEIVTGKVLGFAAVSAVILLIMGLFTFAYLELRAYSMERRIRATLASGGLEPATTATLEHYAHAGLLSTRSLEWPRELEVFSRIPSGDGVEWMGGGRQEYFAVPFALTPDDQAFLNAYSERGYPVVLMTTLRLDRHAPSPEEERELRDIAIAIEATPAGPQLPTTRAATQPGAASSASLPAPAPAYTVQFLDANRRPVAAGADEASAAPIKIPPPAPGRAFGDPRPVPLALPLTLLRPLIDAGKFLVHVGGSTPTIEYGANADSVELDVLDPAHGFAPLRRIKPASFEVPGPPPRKLPRIAFYANVNRTGMQIAGQEDGRGTIGVFHFDGADVGAGRDGKIGLQVRVNVDRGGDLDAERGSATSRLIVQVRNRDTGLTSEPVEVLPETGRYMYVDVPRDSVAGGNFDVLLRGRTRGQYIGLQGPTSSSPSVAVITADRSFAINLFQSLLILWLMSVLVVIIAIFCSTFLSWPIAVMLTLLLLLGRWGVEQLGGALAPGGSHGVVQDIFGIRQPAKAKVVSDSLETLSTVLRNSVKVLPDLDTFPVTEDIERGVSIPAAKLRGAASTTAAFGVPIVVLTYLVLRRKEVAP